MQNRLLRSLVLAAFLSLPAFAGGDDILDGMFIFGPEGSGVEVYLVEGAKEARTIRAVNTAVLKTAFSGLTHIVEAPNDAALREQITVGDAAAFPAEGVRRAAIDFVDGGITFNNFNQPTQGQIPENTQQVGPALQPVENDDVAGSGCGCCRSLKTWVHSWGSK